MSENILSANEKYAEAVGYDYGPASNVVQAALLNGFTHSLNVACKFNPETQIAYLVDELSAEAKKVLTEIAHMIEVSE